MSLRPLLVLFAMLALLAPTGAAEAHSSNFTWHRIHLHLNAYGHWGYCTQLKGTGSVTWSDHSGACWGDQGAELGEIEGRSFLHHSSKCVWSWNGQRFTVTGTDLSGREWKLDGLKSDNFWNFYVETATIGHVQYISGDLHSAPRGTHGGPLAVDLESSSGLSKAGYSIDLQGYVRLK